MPGAWQTKGLSCFPLSILIGAFLRDGCMQVICAKQMTAKVRGYCYRGREKSNKSKKSEPWRKALAFCLSGGRRKPRFHRRVDNAGFRGRIGSEREEKGKKN